ncbi:heterokaryon incompatibility protein-domain-containing protein [Amylocarpus encephaloides]|uniref:Heterokaryon incompatibility protein-domain-containing protein n=1 Tax=Amylocarpus encephaloides TaxID=45428 RepID=A0A9P7YC53_9HELO|nr:heterokaryon incompatibility protein-domain-containing protein [Amylocarpus encephaloides]
MPHLFRDAVVITREMRYRYLWIDSLCIIQDDDADRNREVANMVDIYKNCVFTIAADNCRDSGDRMIGNYLIGDRAREYIQQGCQSTSRGFKSVIYAFNRDQWARSRPSREDDRPGNLDSRAWVLQEQILSPRTLEWTLLELKWTCRATTYSEQCPIERKNPFISATIRAVAAKAYSTKILCLSQQQLTLEWSGSNPELKAQLRHKTLLPPLDIWYHLLL